MNIPEWLLRGLAVNAIWEVIWLIITLVVVLVWNYIKRTLDETDKNITVSLQPATLQAEGRHISVVVSDSIGVSDQVNKHIT